MATGKPYEQTAAERAQVGKWGVFRSSWPSSVDIGQIVRFTAQRVYTARKFNATPRDRGTLLAVFDTETYARAVAETYADVFRDGHAEVDAAAAALATAKARRLEAAEKVLEVGASPPPAPEV